MTTKTLLELHEEVPADHYDFVITHNLFQKYWHWRRFFEVGKIITPVVGKILDIGCHGGLFTNRIRLKTGSKKVYGIDVSVSAINKAKKRIPQGHFQVADAHDLPFERNFFDAIFSMEMLEHVNDPKKVLMEIQRVLKKDGYGLILIPTDSLLFRIIWFLWNLKYHVWNHTHIQSFTSDKLEKMIESTGMKVVISKSFNLGMLKLVKFVNH